MYLRYLSAALLMSCAVRAEGVNQGMADRHRQDEAFRGVSTLSGTLYIPDIVWRWQPRHLELATAEEVQAGLSAGWKGMSGASRAGEAFFILGGHTSGLASARPGLLPQVRALHSAASRLRLPVRGELVHGQVRTGEISFTMRHVMAYQDRSQSSDGWSVVEGKDTGLQGRRLISELLNQVPGYNYRDTPSGDVIPAEAFTGALRGRRGEGEKLAGARVILLENVRVHFPGAEEAVRRWQGNLTLAVTYL